ncbi:MAG TPA: DUF4446 family protein [Candidatus Limnocylindrales bacterium]|nr:DUF4446 family protein [Candidatus Limnocylindrales bacterium]
MDDLNALVAPVIGLIVVALAIASVVLLVLVVLLFRRTSAAERRFASLTRGESGTSLEGILEAHLDKVYAVAREVDEIAARTAVTEAAQRRSFQRIGLVRFNPFEDTGGNQSFALALLDQSGDGFVISSLHARAGTRVYGKAVGKGRSESNLSAEETEALRLALAMGDSPGVVRS